MVRKKRNKKRTKNKKTLNPNSQSPSSKSLFEKNNNSKSRRNKMLSNKDRKNECLIETDNYLNNLNFKDAILLDKRTFCQFFMSLIRKKYIIFIIFNPKYSFNSRIINYCFLLFLFPLYLTINTLFVDAFTIHNIYINKGSFDIVYNIPKIVFATIIAYLLQTIFYNFISTDNDVLEIKNIIEKEKNYIEIIDEKIVIITIKNILFFTISSILLNFCGLYIGCFSAIFSKTKIHLFIRLFLSFSFSLLIPFVINFLATLFRILSLYKINEDLYIISKYIQLI